MTKSRVVNSGKVQLRGGVELRKAGRKKGRWEGRTRRRRRRETSSCICSLIWFRSSSIYILMQVSCGLLNCFPNSFWLFGGDIRPALCWRFRHLFEQCAQSMFMSGKYDSERMISADVKAWVSKNDIQNILTNDRESEQPPNQGYRRSLVASPAQSSEPTISTYPGI